MAGYSTKLTDSNAVVSLAGRADKHSRNVVGGASTMEDQMQIVKNYRLKGIEYGNYMSNNNRVQHLKAAATALSNLAYIIGSSNLGIDHMVGLAFGARGMGGNAAAHYEPAFNMINLTKRKGAGCLAHEYGHALDYNFGSYVDRNKKYAALSGGHEVSMVLTTNTGGQLRAYMNDLLDSICQTDSYKKMLKLTNSDYWFRRTELFARFFEQYVCWKRRNMKADPYLTFSMEYYTANSAYLSVAEIEQLAPKGDRLIKELGTFLNNQGKLKEMPYPTNSFNKVAASAKNSKANTGKTAPKGKKVDTGKSILKGGVNIVKERNPKMYQKTDIAFRKALAKALNVPESVLTILFSLSNCVYYTPQHLTNSIYLDPQGYILGTNGVHLVVIARPIPKQLAGKIIYASGYYESYFPYPNWRAATIGVLPELSKPGGSFKYVGIATQKELEKVTNKDGMVEWKGCPMLNGTAAKKICRLFELLKETANIYGGYKKGNLDTYKVFYWGNNVRAVLSGILSK